MPAASDAPTAGALRGLVADAEHGPLPAVLLAMTIVTGLVDAVSILALGRVFVANMTGNVVFVGFAIARAPGFSLAASLSALAGFLAGAAVAGRLIGTTTARRSLLRAGLALELGLVSVAVVLAAVEGTPIANTTRDIIAAVLALALGVQNGVVRQLKVPDLTTTVLTMTLTGIAADFRHEPHGVILRRILAVATMLAGAVVGAVLVIHVSPTAALGTADGLLAIALALLLIRPDWEAAKDVAAT